MDLLEGCTQVRVSAVIPSKRAALELDVGFAGVKMRRKQKRAVRLQQLLWVLLLRSYFPSDSSGQPLRSQLINSKI